MLDGIHKEISSIDIGSLSEPEKGEDMPAAALLRMMVRI
jgi:hypothetical protein